MAILDSYNEFSSAQEPVASGAIASTNVVDLAGAGDEILKYDAEAKKMRLHILILEAFAGTGTAVTFAFQTDSDVAFGSAATLWTTGAVAKATLVAGYRVTGQGGLPLPDGCERYLRMLYTTDDTFETTGILDAYLSNDADTNEF